jgi:hypothetical protein
MSWNDWSNANKLPSRNYRRRELPSNWQSEVRPKILKRDRYRCRWLENGIRCNAPAKFVDHIDRFGPHTPDNLWSLCKDHNSDKSRKERNESRLGLAPARNGKHWEPHPGMIRPS